MIGSIIHKLQLNDQRGGIAILTALGFLLFSIPLITSSLNLAQNTAIDARVKTEITHRQYCGLAAAEYLSYLMADTGRWDAWLTANPDSSDPTGSTYTEVLDVCGRSITISAVQAPVQPPGDVDDSLESPTVIPSLAAYNKRVLQAIKTVSNANPNGGDSVVYTIKIANHDDKKNELKVIKDTLPPGFFYDCNATADQVTLPGGTPQDITPDDRDDEDFCTDDDAEIKWDIPGHPDLKAGEFVTLTFTVVTSSNFGTYCNGVEASPDGTDNRSGATAIVQIGPAAGLCPGEAAVVTKTWSSMTLTGTNTNTSPRTYTFDVDFEIKVENIGEDDLEITEIIDLLPQGFRFDEIDLNGDIIQNPAEKWENSASRYQYKWRFNPDIELPSNTSKTLRFSATANITRGDYRSDVLADFAGGTFPRDKYTWPTALIEVRDIFNVSASDGGDQLTGLQLVVSDDAGEIDTWTLE